MKQSDRSTLKSYFKKGCIPTEEQFAELIDSVPNIVEDGQVRLADGSWGFYPESGKPLRISLFDAQGKPSAWMLSLDSRKGLVLQNAKGETVATLDQNGKGGDAPQPEEGEYFTFPADKKWHDVVKVLPTSPMYGACQIYACLSGFGHYRLKGTSVAAYHYGTLSCCLSSSRKHWWGWCGKVKMRWYFSDHVLRLQVRSKKRNVARAIHIRVI